MKIRKKLYHLTTEEISAYEQAILVHDYPKEIIDLGFQRYMIFLIPNKTYAAIAWPIIDAMFDVKPDNILLESDNILSDMVRQHMSLDAKIILFPRR